MVEQNEELSSSMSLYNSPFYLQMMYTVQHNMVQGIS